VETFWQNSGNLQGVGKRDERSIDRFIGQLERAVPRALVAVQHGRGSMPDRNIRERGNAR
jgi:hypothetical protein